MKRYFVILMIFILIFLVGCSNAKPLDNPEPELFSVFQEKEDFTLFIRTEIDSDQFYNLMAYYIKGPRGYECFVGQDIMVNYIVLHEDKYYDVVSGAQMNLFTTDELIEWGIDVSCKIDE